MSTHQVVDMTKMVTLGCNLDTLVVSVLPTDKEGQVRKEELSLEMQQELNALKELAQEEEGPVPSRWVFAGRNFFMLPKAGAPFKWILDHPKIKISVSRGLRAPLWAVVRFSSEFLWEWRYNLDRAVSDVWLFLTSIFGENIFLQASSVDLAKDITGWDIGATPLDELLECFISRAASDELIPGGVNEDGLLDGPDGIKRRWRRITGLPFGKRNADVSCTIYDKTHEIKYQSPEKKWFHDLWKTVTDEAGQPLWDGVQPVWRVEGRVKRPALRDAGIESVWDLLAQLPSIWAYIVGHPDGGSDGLPDGWIRYVIPNEDKNRSRWPVHPVWQVVQAPFTPVQPHPAVEPAPPASQDLRPFVRKRKREVNMMRAIAALAGYTSTVEAWREEEHVLFNMPKQIEPDISDTFHFMFKEVQLYLEEKQKKSKKQDQDFFSLVQKKRGIYHLAIVQAATAAV